MQIRGERKREGSLETEVLEVWSGDGRAPSFLSRNKVSRSLSQGRRRCWARRRARRKSGKESYLYPPVRSLTQDCVHALRLQLSISLLVELWNTSCIFHHFKFQYRSMKKKKKVKLFSGSVLLKANQQLMSLNVAKSRKSVSSWTWNYSLLSVPTIKNIELTTSESHRWSGRLFQHNCPRRNVWFFSNYNLTTAEMLSNNVFTTTTAIVQQAAIILVHIKKVNKTLRQKIVIC